jgi:hypothetical protein
LHFERFTIPQCRFDFVIFAHLPCKPIPGRDHPIEN